MLSSVTHDSHLDMGCAPYVWYRVKYIDPVALDSERCCVAGKSRMILMASLYCFKKARLEMRLSRSMIDAVVVGRGGGVGRA